MEVSYNSVVPCLYIAAHWCTLRCNYVCHRKAGAPQGTCALHVSQRALYTDRGTKAAQQKHIFNYLWRNIRQTLFSREVQLSFPQLQKNACILGYLRLCKILWLFFHFGRLIVKFCFLLWVCVCVHSSVILTRRLRPPRSILCMTNQIPVVRLQFLNSQECGVLFYCHYSQVHSDLKWLYLLSSNRSIWKLLTLNKNSWNPITLRTNDYYQIKLLMLDGNTWNYLTVFNLFVIWIVTFCFGFMAYQPL